ncbi:MAG: class I SAM-dependent methyltransferase, partial [Planctomycetota bacterium]
EEFIRQVPDVRVVCLRRDCEEVVRSFSGWSDTAHSVPADHWSRQPVAGLFHDPVWSTIFPKYDVASREEGIRWCWVEYYEGVEELVWAHPQNVRLFEMEDVLHTEAGQRAMLAFVGISEERQVLDIAIRTHDVPQADAERGTEPWSGTNAGSTSQCAILVPTGGSIVPGCEESLRVLEQRGYVVRRVGGYSQIDVARNEIASQALLDGFLETIWIDADIGFHPDAVEKLRAHNLPIVCGIYPKKGRRELACSPLPGTKTLVFGRNGGLHEIQYAATGFLLVRRQVYVDIQFKLGLPLCNETFGANIVPYFMPLIQPHREGRWYLGEDYAFCERARQAGHKILADTTIRLWHVGNYQYGWEDAGREVTRFEDYTYHFGGG